jgi:hypothetical protein
MLLLLTLGATRASADIIDDPLHGFCWGATPVCTDNGVVTPTTTNPPNFGFWASSGPLAGDYFVVVLVPSNEDPSPGSLSFAISGALSGTASLYSTTAWTTGNLETYIGFSNAKPNTPNPGVWGTGATGFYAYKADLGTATLGNSADCLTTPCLNIGPALPTDAVIVGYLIGVKDGHKTIDIGTANSAALLETGPPPPPTPEPGSIALFGSGLLGLAGMIRRRRKQ